MELRAWKVNGDLSFLRVGPGGDDLLEAAGGADLLEAGVFCAVVLGAALVLEEEEVFIEDGPPDDRCRIRRLSVGPSNCQSIPCCLLMRSRFSLRASRSSFVLFILSG